MENKTNTNNEIKQNKEEKMIKTIRITGVVLFLIGISIIFTTVIIRETSKKKEPEEEIIIYDSSSRKYYLDDEEDSLLNVEENYLIIDTYEEYENILIEIDDWSNNMLSNYTSQINESDFYDEETKTTRINEYMQTNNERVKIIKDTLKDANITEEKFNEKSYVLVEDITKMQVLEKSNLIDICKNENVLTIHIDKSVVGVVGGAEVVLYVIELEKEQIKDSEIVVNISSKNNSDPDVAYKPIIYIYPEKEMNINVELGYKENITVSYPKYINNWNVLAHKDGTLIDNKTNKELYALYYESQNNIDFKIEEEGFVISKDEIIPFLESKLETLGLNAKESEEFIIYWLPILIKNKYNYIRFASKEEINKNMPLNIEPKPQTIIRVLMTFKGLDEKINVKEQKLDKIERKGYTVVEWGATILE